MRDAESFRDRLPYPGGLPLTINHTSHSLTGRAEPAANFSSGYARLQHQDLYFYALFPCHVKIIVAQCDLCQ